MLHLVLGNLNYMRFWQFKWLSKDESIQYCSCFMCSCLAEVYIGKCTKMNKVPCHAWLRQTFSLCSHGVNAWPGLGLYWAVDMLKHWIFFPYKHFMFHSEKEDFLLELGHTVKIILSHIYYLLRILNYKHLFSF